MALAGPTNNLGRYRLESRLGVGGMGEVYAASAIGPDGVEKLVAIKLVREDHLRDPYVVQMFVEEAKVAFLLTHPNVIQTYELGEVDGHYFLVMEYVDGINLEDLIRVAAKSLKQPLPTAFALYIGAQIARGLAYAHELPNRQGEALNIVHRDVSPTNVLLSNAGQVKVTDFGLAKSLMRRVHSQGTVVGKLAYMAPEQLRSAAVDARTDIYALGITLYEMMAGMNPFGRLERGYPQRLAAVIPPLAERAPHLDSRVVALVERCVADEIEARWSSAHELGRALDGCMRTLGLNVSDYELADFIARAKRVADEPARDDAAGPHPFDRALGLELDRMGTPGGVAFGDEGVVTFTARKSTLAAPVPSTLVAATKDSSPEPAAPTALVLRRLHRWPWLGLAALLLGMAALWFAWPAEDPRDHADRGVAVSRADLRTPDAAARHSDVSVSPAPARPPRKARLAPRPSQRPRSARTKAAKPGATQQMGRVSINSEPWSIIYLDGRRIRSTPIIGYALPVGRHTVRFLNPARQIDVERQVTVAPNETTRLSVVLER